MVNENKGSIRVADKIIYDLVAEAALSVEGVYSVLGYEHNHTNKKIKEEMEVRIEGQRTYIKVQIIADQDINIVKLAEAVQLAISAQMESMLRIVPDQIDVVIQEIKYRPKN